MVAAAIMGIYLSPTYVLSIRTGHRTVYGSKYTLYRMSDGSGRLFGEFGSMDGNCCYPPISPAWK